MRVRLALVALVLWSVPAFTQTRFAGRVVGVTDGDTISVMRDGRSVRVRLEGIDCPESGQDFGPAPTPPWEFRRSAPLRRNPVQSR